MIKKNILERFNDRGGAIVRGKRGKYFKKTTHNKKKHKNGDIFWLVLDVYWTGTHHFACGDFFTFSIDLEWSQGLGSLKMKV